MKNTVHTSPEIVSEVSPLHFSFFLEKLQLDKTDSVDYPQIWYTELLENLSDIDDYAEKTVFSLAEELYPSESSVNVIGMKLHTHEKGIELENGMYLEDINDKHKKAEDLSYILSALYEEYLFGKRSSQEKGNDKKTAFEKQETHKENKEEMCLFMSLNPEEFWKQASVWYQKSPEKFRTDFIRHFFMNNVYQMDIPNKSMYDSFFRMQYPNFIDFDSEENSFTVFLKKTPYEKLPCDTQKYTIKLSLDNGNTIFHVFDKKMKEISPQTDFKKYTEVLTDVMIEFYILQNHSLQKKSTFVFPQKKESLLSRKLWLSLAAAMTIYFGGEKIIDHYGEDIKTQVQEVLSEKNPKPTGGSELSSVTLEENPFSHPLDSEREFLKEVSFKEEDIEIDSEK